MFIGGSMLVLITQPARYLDLVSVTLLPIYQFIYVQYLGSRAWNPQTLNLGVDCSWPSLFRLPSQ